MMMNSTKLPAGTPVRQTVRQRDKRWRYGHPALDLTTCLQCYGALKRGSILCSACNRAAVEEHRDKMVNISKRRGSPCFLCREASEGVVIFVENEIAPFCLRHARQWRSLDCTPRHGFVSYGAIPGTVGSHL